MKTMNKTCSRRSGEPADEDDTIAISYAKFIKYAPTPENLKLFQQIRPSTPANPVLGFALTLAPLGEPAQTFVGGWLGASMCLGGACVAESLEMQLDALRIASLCGKPDIVETLLFHKRHSPEREAEACELLGAARVFCTDTMEWFCNEPWNAAACWSRALQLRANLHGSKESSWRSRLMCLREVRPMSTVGELDDLASSRHAMFIQAFLVLERVLGLPWTLQKPPEAVDFIATRLLRQMVRGICRTSLSTADALELLGYLIVYAPDRAALTRLFAAMDEELDLLSAGPNILTLKRDCKDLTVRQAVDFLRFVTSRHPTRAGYSHVRVIRLVCSKIDVCLLNEPRMAKLNVTKEHLSILLHAICVVWVVFHLSEDPPSEALAMKLLELGVPVHEPCWFRVKSSLQIAVGNLQKIIERFHAS
ncbi:hypothetical protein BIW11_02383 [Tropilaelaps mercedesae]|uniref:Uncharacterized protein n=1 Tax=Tropilaelaps mercedesae TaxID=418985 RepID=A0A1V9WYA2_9ACAR|nr:hypothetical protein BIW11_02383 [Tropilaelaps mercedesae]